jgi:hypothetical protein
LLQRVTLAAVLSIGVFAVLSYPAIAAARTLSDIDVRMRLSRPSIRLGEPVWVVVSIRNATSAPLAIDIAGYCPSFRTMPMTVDVAGATPGTGRNMICQYGLPGGDCMEATATVVAPGASVYHRYPLEGDFRLTHPGVDVNKRSARVCGEFECAHALS